MNVLSFYMKSVLFLILFGGCFSKASIDAIKKCVNEKVVQNCQETFHQCFVSEAVERGEKVLLSVMNNESIQVDMLAKMDGDYFCKYKLRNDEWSFESDEIEINNCNDLTIDNIQLDRSTIFELNIYDRKNNLIKEQISYEIDANTTKKDNQNYSCTNNEQLKVQVHKNVVYYTNSLQIQDHRIFIFFMSLVNDGLYDAEIKVTPYPNFTHADIDYCTYKITEVKTLREFEPVCSLDGKRCTSCFGLHIFNLTPGCEYRLVLSNKFAIREGKLTFVTGRPSVSFQLLEGSCNAFLGTVSNDKLRSGEACEHYLNENGEKLAQIGCYFDEKYYPVCNVCQGDVLYTNLSPKTDYTLTIKCPHCNNFNHTFRTFEANQITANVVTRMHQLDANVNVTFNSWYPYKQETSKCSYFLRVSGEGVDELTEAKCKGKNRCRSCVNETIQVPTLETDYQLYVNIRDSIQCPAVQNFSTSNLDMNIRFNTLPTNVEIFITKPEHLPDMECNIDIDIESGFNCNDIDGCNKCESFTVYGLIPSTVYKMTVISSLLRNPIYLTFQTDRLFLDISADVYTTYMYLIVTPRNDPIFNLTENHDCQVRVFVENTNVYSCGVDNKCPSCDNILIENLDPLTSYEVIYDHKYLIKPVVIRAFTPNLEIRQTFKHLTPFLTLVNVNLEYRREERFSCTVSFININRDSDIRCYNTQLNMFVSCPKHCESFVVYAEPKTEFLSLITSPSSVITSRIEINTMGLGFDIETKAFPIYTELNISYVSEMPLDGKCEISLFNLYEEDLIELDAVCKGHEPCPNKCSEYSSVLLIELKPLHNYTIQFISEYAYEPIIIFISTTYENSSLDIINLEQVSFTANMKTNFKTNNDFPHLCNFTLINIHNLIRKYKINTECEGIVFDHLSSDTRYRLLARSNFDVHNRSITINTLIRKITGLVGYPIHDDVLLFKWNMIRADNPFMLTGLLTYEKYEQIEMPVLSSEIKISQGEGLLVLSSSETRDIRKVDSNNEGYTYKLCAKIVLSDYYTFCGDCVTCETTGLPPDIFGVDIPESETFNISNTEVPGEIVISMDRFVTKSVSSCKIISGIIFSQTELPPKYTLDARTFNNMGPNNASITIENDIWTVQSELSESECSELDNFVLGDNSVDSVGYVNKKIPQDVYVTAVVLVCRTRTYCEFSSFFDLTWVNMNSRNIIIAVIAISIVGFIILVATIVLTSYINKALFFKNTDETDADRLITASEPDILDVFTNENDLARNRQIKEYLLAHSKRMSTSAINRLQSVNQEIKEKTSTRKNKYKNMTKKDLSLASDSSNSIEESESSTYKKLKNKPVKSMNASPVAKLNQVTQSSGRTETNIFSNDFIRSGDFRAIHDMENETFSTIQHIMHPIQSRSESESLNREHTKTMLFSKNTKLIKVDDLSLYIDGLLENNLARLETLWKKMYSVLPDTCKVGNLAGNYPRNRYKYIIPGDKYRVKLKKSIEGKESDYINASYMPGINSDSDYIVTQGPLNHTTDHFWQMVYENKANTIVMLTNWARGLKNNVNYYFPAELCATSVMLPSLDSLSIEVIAKDQSVNVDITTIRLSIEKEDDEECESVSQNIGPDRQNIQNNSTSNSSSLSKKEDLIVKHFLYKSWPSEGIPTNMQPLATLRRMVNNWQDENSIKVGKEVYAPPIVVHCSSGVGRTGAYIMFDYNMNRVEIKKLETLDLEGYMAKIRTRRCFMIQQPEYYILSLNLLRKCLSPDRSTFLTIEEFRTDIYDALANRPSVLIDEFKKLEITKKYELNSVRTNRYVPTGEGHILTLIDEAGSQVKILDNENELDICCIDSLVTKQMYLCSANPEVENVEDFIAVLFQYHITLVVHVGDPSSCFSYFCGTYTSENSKITIETYNEEPGTIIRRLLIVSHKESLYCTFVQLKDFDLQNFRGNHSTAKGIISVFNTVRKKLGRPPNCLIHSANIQSESSVILACLMWLEQIFESSPILSVAQVVGLMRSAKPLMMPTTAEFYSFIDIFLRILRNLPFN